MKTTQIGCRLCMRKDCGLRSNLFGGILMAWIDEIAFLCAKKISGEKYMVTKKIGEIIFVHPIKEGDVVDFFASNVKRGTTSVSFDIQVKVGALTVCESSAVFVAVDGLGQKRIIQKFQNEQTPTN